MATRIWNADTTGYSFLDATDPPWVNGIPAITLDTIDITVTPPPDGGKPVTGTFSFIANAYPITLTNWLGGAAIGNVTCNAGASGNAIVVGAAVTGNVTMTDGYLQLSGAVTGTTTINAGTLEAGYSCTGTVTLNSGVFKVAGGISVVNVVCAGGVLNGGGATLTVSGMISGAFLYDQATAIVGNLDITSLGLFSSGSLAVTGNVTVTTGTATGPATVSGNVTLADGATWSLAGSSIALDVNGTAGTTGSGAIEMDGGVIQGIVNLTACTWTVTGGGGQLLLDQAGTLNLGATTGTGLLAVTVSAATTLGADTTVGTATVTDALDLDDLDFICQTSLTLSGGTVDIGAGLLDINSGAGLTGSGTIVIDGGVIAGVVNMTACTWTVPEGYYGTVTIDRAGTLKLGGDAAAIDLVINASGTVTLGAAETVHSFTRTLGVLSGTRLYTVGVGGATITGANSLGGLSLALGGNLTLTGTTCALGTLTVTASADIVVDGAGATAVTSTSASIVPNGHTVTVSNVAANASNPINAVGCTDGGGNGAGVIFTATATKKKSRRFGRLMGVRAA